ncbi:MAG: hypothetical protein WCE30_08280 [Mycobacterium sp.]
MSNLDDLFDLLEDMKADELAANYAYHMALGQFGTTDPPEDPGCTAIVLEGKLFSLSVCDEYARNRDADFVSFTLNSVIMNAFRVWRLDYERLVKAAKQRLDNDPQARQQLRLELEQSSRN